MRCFYHGDVEAVAVCKSCGHGICHDCCAEVGTSAACRNRCESDVVALNDIIARSRTQHLKVSGLYVRMALFFGAISALVLTGGVRELMHGTTDYVSFVIAFLFGMFGVSCYMFARRFRRQ